MKKFYKFNSFISLYFDSFPVEIKVIFLKGNIRPLLFIICSSRSNFYPPPPKNVNRSEKNLIYTFLPKSIG